MTIQLSVLVVCEESGKVRNEFRRLGHNAYSNDLVQARDGSEYHLKMDAFDAISTRVWDIIILHPPCDYLASSGNNWYSYGKPKFYLRKEALAWTIKLWYHAKNHSDHVAMENPIGVLSGIAFMEATQWIHPRDHGHIESKKTGLWLHNLPKLVPTKIVPKPQKGSIEEMAAHRLTNMPRKESRKRDRSETFLGIAKAMAYQWSQHVINQKEI